MSRITHGTDSATLADILERVLDKGVVIAGDIKIKLVEVELLTIQVRLMIASVDKARELGMDWWSREPAFSGASAADADRVERLERQIAALEARLGDGAGGAAEAAG